MHEILSANYRPKYTDSLRKEPRFMRRSTAALSVSCDVSTRPVPFRPIVPSAARSDGLRRATTAWDSTHISYAYRRDHWFKVARVYSLGSAFNGGREPDEIGNRLTFDLAPRTDRLLRPRASIRPPHATGPAHSYTAYRPRSSIPEACLSRRAHHTGKRAPPRRSLQPPGDAGQLRPDTYVLGTETTNAVPSDHARQSLLRWSLPY